MDIERIKKLSRSYTNKFGVDISHEEIMELINDFGYVYYNTHKMTILAVCTDAAGVQYPIMISFSEENKYRIKEYVDVKDMISRLKGDG